MATPVKSVQCNNVATLIQMYLNAGIPDFGIRQGQALNFVYEDGVLDDGKNMLKQYADLLHRGKSAAIYTLCLYKKVPPEGIDEGTKASLSWNFRFYNETIGFSSGEQFGGGYGELLQQVKDLKQELAELKADPEAGKLGVIGELLEHESLQPIVLGIATRIADFIAGPPKQAVGELKRVSGVPTAAGPGGAWRQDPRICAALDILSADKDLPAVMDQLAGIMQKKPGQWAFYKTMLMKMKV